MRGPCQLSSFLRIDKCSPTHPRASPHSPAVALKVGEVELACFEYDQILLRHDLGAEVRAKVVQRLVHAEELTRRQALDALPWHERTFVSERELLRWQDVGRAPAPRRRSIEAGRGNVGSVPVSELAAHHGFVPLRTSSTTTVSSLSYADLGVWQTRALDAAAGGGDGSRVLTAVLEMAVLTVAGWLLALASRELL